MKNSIKVLIAGVLLAVLSGCASPRIQSAGIDESAYEANSVPASHTLHRNVSVKTEGFLETSKNLFAENNKSSLNDEDAKKAIERSLDHAGMLGNSNSEYVLTAKLIDADLGNIWVNKASRREITIEYNLVSLFSENIYDNIITGVGENDFKIITFDNYGREKRAAEKAYKDNFRQLIEDLKKLK